MPWQRVRWGRRRPAGTWEGKQCPGNWSWPSRTLDAAATSGSLLCGHALTPVQSSLTLHGKYRSSRQPIPRHPRMFLPHTNSSPLHRKEKGGLAGLGQRQVTKKRKGHENTLSRTRYKQSPMLNFNFYQALMPPFEGKGILPPNQRHVQAQNDGVSVTWRRVHAQSCRPRRLLDTAHSARPICTPLTHSHGPLCSSLMHTPHPQSHPTTPCPPHVLKSEHPPVLVMP